MKHVMYTSEKYEHYLIPALRNDSVAARDSLDEVIQEDKKLRSPEDIKQLKYYKITIEEITLDSEDIKDGSTKAHS